jgi:hypothetical protein
MFTSERHDDHLLEVGNRCQQQLSDTLHAFAQTIEHENLQRYTRSRTCSPQLIHSDSTSSTGRSSSSSSFVCSERSLPSKASVFSATWPIFGKKSLGSDSTIMYEACKGRFVLIESLDGGRHPVTAGRSVSSWPTS